MLPAGMRVSIALKSEHRPFLQNGSAWADNSAAIALNASHLSCQSRILCLPCVNYSSVLLLGHTPILSTKYLEGTGNANCYCYRRRGFTNSRESWFNQEDVNQLVDAGMNTVRIPVRVVALSL